LQPSGKLEEISGFIENEARGYSGWDREFTDSLALDRLSVSAPFRPCSEAQNAVLNSKQNNPN
jgi:hypothetical protein